MPDVAEIAPFPTHNRAIPRSVYGEKRNVSGVTLYVDGEPHTFASAEAAEWFAAQYVGAAA